jgi:GMP synthase-like glutamine amidotransferase
MGSAASATLLLGILNAIPFDPDRVVMDNQPVDAYIRFFEQVNPPFEYRGYAVHQGEFPGAPDECDAYLITGSPKGVYDRDPWIAELSQFIRQASDKGRRLVGICFGHQILAHAREGHAENYDRGWGIGRHSFELVRTKPWMNDKPDLCSLYFIHQDQVIDLPPGAERLGGNAFCPNAFYAIGDQVVGIQGHPEFTEHTMRNLLRWYQGKLEPPVHETAVRSMEHGEPDNLLVAQWLVSFLTAPAENDDKTGHD